MTYLSVPIPVARLLKRLFNVVSSLAISDQYLLVQKADGNGSAVVPKDASWMTPSSLPAGGAELSSPGVEQTTSVAAALRARNFEGVTYTRRGTSLSRGAHSLASDDVSQNSDHDRHGTDRYSSGGRVQQPRTPPRIPSPYHQDESSNTRRNEPLSPIQELLLHPLLFDPVRRPRYPLVLCHGLYGFDVRGPSAFPFLQMHYWSNVMRILKKKIGAEVLVTGVPGTGSVESRAEKLDEHLRKNARGRAINFVAHSMGGLDCRHLISNMKPEDYVPLSLTTICTPHRGSPFMDWCTENIGIGKPRHPSRDSAESMYKDAAPSPPPKPSNSQFTLSSLPSSFTTLLLSMIDSPAYANLTTSYLRDVFNPATLNDPSVKYFSVAARTENINVWHPLWLPKMVLDGVEEKERASKSRPDRSPPREPWEVNDWGNDGLVSVRSAKWGEFLGTLDGVDHWEIRGAGGLSSVDWHVDLSIPSVVRNSLSDPFSTFGKEGWSWRDWGRFVGLWKREQERQEHERPDDRSMPQSASLEAAKDVASRDSSVSDDVLKSSTDKLSAVIDWAFQQVPGTSSSKSNDPGSPSLKEQERVDERKAAEAQAKDPRLKFDLEKFYIALTRKLYNEGL
ncbi:alpha/beta-hydrolase [Schizopora paradoxa]|uniref:Alpha/beta-hydrolase n=1 Tax=Schizopora paradoxa TaxID=27342 RepID=A0A0H2S2H3_9AGAM|nr:alpha/beta-hydrolase [Schizopora paradoxa]